MRRAFAWALALSVVTLSAHADDNTTGSGLRPFIGGGFTWGGETLQPIVLIPTGTTTHYEEDISAGSGLDLRMGLSYRLGSSPYTLQAAVAYANDQTHGTNGKTYFRRYPVELMLQANATEQFRVGFGFRKALGGHFSRKGFTCPTPSDPEATCATLSEDLNSSIGVILEGEYMLTPSWGMKLRYVHESFKFNNQNYDPKSYDGDHIGVITAVYFN